MKAAWTIFLENEGLPIATRFSANKRSESFLNVTSLHIVLSASLATKTLTYVIAAFVLLQSETVIDEDARAVQQQQHLAVIVDLERNSRSGARGTIKPTQ